MSNSVNITIRFSNTIQDIIQPFMGALMAAGEPVRKIVKDILLLPKAIEELISIERDYEIGTITSRGEVFFRYEPSECHDRLLTAIWAGNTDYLSAEYNRLCVKLGGTAVKGKAAAE